MESPKRPPTTLNTGSLDPVSCELRHGILLRIEQFERPMPIYGLVRLLSDATSHFKRLAGAVDGAMHDARVYEAVVDNQGDILAKLHWRETTEGRLTAFAWSEALTNAWSNAQTLEEISKNKRAYRSAIGEEPDGWIAQALKLFLKPGGEIQAFALKMEWDRAAELRSKDH